MVSLTFLEAQLLHSLSLKPEGMRLRNALKQEEAFKTPRALRLVVFGHARVNKGGQRQSSLSHWKDS